MPATCVAGIFFREPVAHRPYVADDGRKLEAVPVEFVGTADNCGAGYAAGSTSVTAAWLKGMGHIPAGLKATLNYPSCSKAGSDRGALEQRYTSPRTGLTAFLVVVPVLTRNAEANARDGVRLHLGRPLAVHRLLASRDDGP